MTTTGHNSGVAGDQLRAFIERMTVHDLIAAFDATEVWRPIAGYPGYEVSSWGKVKGKRVGVLQSVTSRGYHFVTLSHEGVPKVARVARLVAETFLGPQPFEGAHAAHSDGNKDNNRVSNLRWATAHDNQADVTRHGNRTRGSMVFGARLQEDDIPKIRERISNGERYPIIAADYSVSTSTISLIKLRRIWDHV